MIIGKISIILVNLTLLLGNVAASATDEAEKHTPWWESSKQTVEKWWNKSNQLVDKWFSATENQESLFSQTWRQIIPKMENVLQLEQEKKTLPDSAWFFSRDKQDNGVKINQLLNEAVNILSTSDMTDTRQRIGQLENKIRELKHDIFQYRQAQISAPTAAALTDYEGKIKEAQILIDNSQQEIERLKAEFVQQLANKGLIITKAQLEVLLSSIVGDDIIQSGIVYDNVNQISQQLMTLTLKSGEDLETTQRYYGMYTVLLKILLTMQENILAKINDKYLPKIEQITAEVQTLSATTNNLLEGELDDNRRRHLLANLAAQQLTTKTAELYKQHLINQYDKIVTAIKKTMADLRIAENTYNTVKVSGELVDFLRTSQKSFDVLLNLQIPDQLAFENLQMKQEFTQLTKRLAE